MAGVPILGKRRERRQAEMTAAVEAEVEKAMTPAVAMAAQMSRGATYAVNPSSPFNQVGPGQGFQPLPREPGTFDSGFGPANPLWPDAIDPLTPAGRTLARRTEYLIAANVNLVDRRVPWSVLKGLAEDVDIVQRCIQIVQDAIVGLNWSWGFSPQIIQQIMTEQGIINTAKASAIAREKYGDELTRVQEFFNYPDKRMGFTFSQWLTDIIYSHLVYDGIVVAPEYTLGGELLSLSTIDTSTIKILLDNQGFIPRPPNPAFQQILYGFPRGEFQAEDVQADGSVPNGFTGDQMTYYIRRPRPSSIYGYSQVEECINIATIYMERQAWLHAEYSHGVTPKMVITTEGTEGWSPEQLAYYERIYNDQFAGQTQRRQNFMLMRPGMRAQQLRTEADAYRSEYDKWLVMQIGAKFGIPQSSLGISPGASLGGASAGKDQGDQYEAYATDALKNFLIECINDLARRFLGVGSELTITATGGGNDDDNLTRAQADASDIGAGIRTRNEIRAERGIPLINEPEADQLGVTGGPTGVTFLAGTFAQQQQAATEPKAGPDAGTTQPGGTPADEGQSDGPSGSGSSVGGSSDTGNSDTEGASSKVKPSDKPSVQPKDDKRQADVEKELTSFLRFAKSRTDRHSWRGFEFVVIPEDQASVLNKAGESGDMTAVRDAVANINKSSGEHTAAEKSAPLGHEFYGNKYATGTGGGGSPVERAKATYEAGRAARDSMSAGDKASELASRAGDLGPRSGSALRSIAEGHADIAAQHEAAGEHDQAQIHAEASSSWHTIADIASGNSRITSDSPEYEKINTFIGAAQRLTNAAAQHSQAVKASSKPDYDEMFEDRKGEPFDKDLYARVIASAKRKFDVYPSAVANGWVVQEYKRRGGEYRKPATKASSDSFTPPKSVQEAAQRAVQWFEDGHDGATNIGRGRAHDLATGKAVSLDTIKRISSYLARHAVDKKAEGFNQGEDGFPSPGRVAWDAWGGDPAIGWTNSILDSQEAEKSLDIENATAIAMKMIQPELERLRQTYGLLGKVKSTASTNRDTADPYWNTPEGKALLQRWDEARATKDS